MNLPPIVRAFFLAPAVGGVTFATLVGLLDGSGPRANLAMSAAMFAYASAIVVGIPLYAATRRWRLRSLGFYVLATLITAAVPATWIGLLLKDVVMPALALVSAVVAGFCFWKVAEANRPTDLEY